MSGSARNSYGSAACSTLALIALLCGAWPATAQLPKDVAPNHWASGAVRDVVSRGIMPARDGMFKGDATVSRRDLTIALALFARSLERRQWPSERSVKSPTSDHSTRSQKLTRYELAATLSRIGRHALQGIPPSQGKAIFGSVVIPRGGVVKAPSTEPGYEAATYLSRNRMAYGNVVTLNPGPQPVTAGEAQLAIAFVLVGLNDKFTDEPQNRDDIGPPPAHRK